MGDQVTGLLSGKLRKERMRAVRPYLIGRVLDVGCGVGELAPECDVEGYLGVDIDVPSIKIAKKQFPTYTFTTELPSEGTFDTVVMLAVIEHVPDPANFLAKHVPLLAPEGNIVMTTPHKNAEWLHVLGASVGLFSSSAKDEHETLFNLSLMKKTAQEAGLRVSKYERFLFGVNQLFIVTTA
ncbi:MAG: class I SAM-dependent methyltransferase [Phycisphaerae bacterium]|jgi:2-polyprenyl-3-methyl-5-hydroxy-6-metoxy-1,4-benzoquinol methylase|nr:class I SAM-dependent methyltransferase [Phycisphaerae bacterium]